MDLKERAKDLINWRELSIQVSKKQRDTIRRDRVPEKNKEEIDLLLSYIEAWLNCKELTTKESIIAEVEREVREKIIETSTEIHKLGKNFVIKP